MSSITAEELSTNIVLRAYGTVAPEIQVSTKSSTTDLEGSEAVRRSSYIAGIHEFEARVTPGHDALAIKAECASKALQDAGLPWSSVDGIYDCGESETVLPGLGVAEYLGIRPSVIDTTHVGGSSYEVHVARAAQDIAAGRVKVALITYGSTLRSDSRSGGVPMSLGDRETPAERFERPHNLSLVGNYGMAAARHMHDYGTTPEQLAHIAVSARRHALRNPLASAGMEQMGMRRRGALTTDDVLASKLIADPIHLLECCLVTDGGGALVLVSSDVLPDTRHAPVEILGAGVAMGLSQNGADLTTTAAVESGRQAFSAAGITPGDIDVAMLYDSFTITVLLLLEDLGFCPKGAGGAFVESGALDFDTAGGPAVNTDGGGLSSTHPGMRGIFLLLEATRQLRGDSTSQVDGAELAVCSGIGGFISSRYASATVILGRSA